MVTLLSLLVIGLTLTSLGLLRAFLQSRKQCRRQLEEIERLKRDSASLSQPTTATTPALAKPQQELEPRKQYWALVVLVSKDPNPTNGYYWVKMAKERGMDYELEGDFLCHPQHVRWARELASGPTPAVWFLDTNAKVTLEYQKRVVFPSRSTRRPSAALQSPTPKA